MPRGDDNPEKQRVCSKGCNQLVKVSKITSEVTLSSATINEAHMFSLVVCQANKQVVCNGRTGDQSVCSQQKTVAPVALCNFTVSLWNIGGTCIANHLYGEKFPQCPNKTRSTAVESIPGQCRNATEVSKEIDCQETPNEKSCAAMKAERTYCTRIAMSF